MTPRRRRPPLQPLGPRELRVATEAARAGAPFSLPAEITVQREPLADGQAYAFRHRSLGLLGRLVLQDTSGGQAFIRCEVAGDPADPLTATRKQVLEPLTRDLVARLERGLASAGRGPAALDAVPPPPPPSGGEWIRSQILLCEVCQAQLVHLVFAPPGEEPALFEDCARKMYATYSSLGLPTFILGPIDEWAGKAGVMQVWPERSSLEHLSEREFDERLAPLLRHC